MSNGKVIETYSTSLDIIRDGGLLQHSVAFKPVTSKYIMVEKASGRKLFNIERQGDRERKVLRVITQGQNQSPRPPTRLYFLAFPPLSKTGISWGTKPSVCHAFKNV